MPRTPRRRNSAAALVRTAAAVALALAAALPATLAAQPSDSAIFAAFRWRNIGPANPGGRIVDIEAVENDFRTVFMATASGGVFKSVNAGTTWDPIFDHYGSASIGDIALFQPNPDIVWVGTGEANNRNSVSWGDGIYKSTDGGATFTNMGLESTHQIARVVTHPSNPNIVYVAAVGHLWGYSGERGLFKTTDGGRSWSKLAGGLPDDGRTGATDLVMDPRNPEVLYVAFYHRLRQPHHFHSGGPSGGMFKSTNGGRTWTKLTRGLPAGETGRIGLAIYRADPRILMAMVEAERSSDLGVPGSGVYRSEDAGASWTYVNTYNNRPFYYSNIRINPRDHQRVYVLTTTFQVSSDGFRTYRNGSDDQEIHGDFHAMWLDPDNADRYYIGADKGMSLTHDHGEHFTFFDNVAIAQYYRIGVDMRDPYYVYGGLQDNGSFAGPSFTRDVRGILNDDNWKMHWGDGMYVQIDPTDWRKVYTEAENGSFRRYDALTFESQSSRPSRNNITNWDEVIGTRTDRPGFPLFRFNWTSPLVMSPHDPSTLYLGGNHVFRTTNQGHSWEIISPDLSTNDTSKVVQGRSGGITSDNTGAEDHGTVHTLSESAARPGVIWAGTDDGNVQVTRDAGRTWTNVRGNIQGVPDGIWVSRVEASHHDPAVAYVSFDGHRSDINRPWIYRTSDYGRTFSNITSNIPEREVVLVIREDLRNPSLLFAGTEHSLYASINGGGRWTRLMNNLPTVAIQDLVIHPRDMDLVAGTHGRSIWILDDISPLQQLTPEVLAADGHVFAQRRATIWENVSRGGQRGHFWFAGENPPEFQASGDLPRVPHRNVAIVTYWLGSNARGPVTLRISEPGNNGRSHTEELPAEPGMHRFEWNLRFSPEPQPGDTGAVGRGGRGAGGGGRGGGRGGRGGGGGGRGGGQSLAAGPGTYIISLTVNGKTYSNALLVRADPITSTR